MQRIRSWRLTSVPYNDTNDRPNKETLYFAFEYLFAKDDLRWVTIQSEQAIMMSMAMQAMVDEIIREQEGKGIREYSQGRKRNNSQSTVNEENSPTSDKEKATSEKETKETKETKGTGETKGRKPFAQTRKSNAFSWKDKKETGPEEVFAKNIGDDDL